jgi:alpha-glucosidase
MELWNMKDAAYKTMAKNALLKRLEFVPYFYTLLFQVSNSGGSMVTPMFFANPSDAKAYEAEAQGSFMVGAIKVSPVMVDSKTTTFDSYFPIGSWVDLNDFKTILTIADADHQVQKLNTAAAKDFPIAHLGEGAIIPWVDNSL